MERLEEGDTTPQVLVVVRVVVVDMGHREQLELLLVAREGRAVPQLGVQT
jgi:hypothetical protein